MDLSTFSSQIIVFFPLLRSFSSLIVHQESSKTSTKRPKIQVKLNKESTKTPLTQIQLKSNPQKSPSANQIKSCGVIMSQSLIVFEPSGKVVYQLNNKISPFNEFIYTIVDQTCTELDAEFSTASVVQKRFYSLRGGGLYAALYFDVVSTLDSDKIRLCLDGVLKTYAKLGGEDDDKMAKLIEYQFQTLVQLRVSSADSATERRAENFTEKVASRPVDPSAPKGLVKKPTSAKKMRKWVNGELVDVSESGVLDYSEAVDSSAADTVHRENAKVNKAAFQKEDNLVLLRELNDVLNDAQTDSVHPDTDAGPASGFFSKLSSYFGASADINEVSKKFEEQLISKNIAPATARTIIEKIKARLSSKAVTVPVFKQTLTEELTKILTPNVSTDLLHDIKKCPLGRPYVISVVGVNGVGKSTNLAKLAYWFLQNNMSVLICACDTFRSGAVEQLNVHVRSLKTLNSGSARIDLFEKGYGGGDHVVTTAKLAIAHAAAENYDIVLIDTAGRTHSNAKLMAPLKKFGDAANPDKIIMVGEALVGTDSVEQAVNFDNAFGNRRGLDFFIISKVDTVGDLVGAMINMVMATKVPILFIGTGQTYTDINKLSVKRVVDMLTS